MQPDNWSLLLVTGHNLQLVTTWKLVTVGHSLANGTVMTSDNSPAIGHSLHATGHTPLDLSLTLAYRLVKVSHPYVWEEIVFQNLSQQRIVLKVTVHPVHLPSC